MTGFFEGTREKKYTYSGPSLAPVLREFQIELRKWGRELLIKKVPKTFRAKGKFQT